MKIELNCAKCGQDHFNLDEGFADHAVIFCNDCDHRIGTMAEVRERVASEVLKRSLAQQFG